MKRLFDFDPLTGVTQWFHYNEATGDWGLESVQDVEPIIESNKAMQKDENYSKDGIKREWWHAARIPVVIQEKWLREEGIDVFKTEHWPRLKKKLNDPDWMYLKTTTGKV